jgi:hypothetical protein
MQRHSLTGFRCRFCAVLAFLFALLTIGASGPHRHDSPASSASAIATASQRFVTDLPNCSLCDWLMASYTAPSGAASTVAVSTPLGVMQFAVTAVSLCCLSVPHRHLRAPPTGSF